MKDKLLTICIPTYKRAKELDRSLICFEKELKSVDVSLVEFFISDNCSPDNTSDIVEKYVGKGLPIIYSRNEENIGPDNNFLKCFYAARSKYLWLLGDDDYIVGGILKKILDILQKNNIGCLNIKCMNMISNGTHVFKDNQEFLITVGHWLTFMSGNIICTDFIKSTSVTDWLRKSYLLQMPFFIDAILQHSTNIVLKEEVFERCDDDSNGGYNFYKVFVANYLFLWKSYLYRGEIKWITYWEIKRRVLSYFVYPFTKKFFLQNKFPNIDKRKGWLTLLRNYWFEPYFYWYCMKFLCAFCKNKIK